MILSDPKLKKRADGSLPKTNAFIGDIYETIFDGKKTCIHYSVNDSTQDIAIKLLVSDKHIDENTDKNELLDALDDYYDRTSISSEFTFFKKNNFVFHVLVIDDSNDWTLETNFMAAISYTIFDTPAVDIIKQDKYQKFLVETCGINRTNKPLIYSTTEFEGFLSDISIPSCARQDITLFPGDVDCIIFDESSNAKAVFEFKKHTSASFKVFDKQSYLLYFYKDKKKYEGIAAVTTKCKLNHFYNIIYSTNWDESHNFIIEKIDVSLKLLNREIKEFVNIYDFKAYIKSLF